MILNQSQLKMIDIIPLINSRVWTQASGTEAQPSSH